MHRHMDFGMVGILPNHVAQDCRIGQCNGGYGRMKVTASYPSLPDDLRFDALRPKQLRVRASEPRQPDQEDRNNKAPDSLNLMPASGIDVLSCFIPHNPTVTASLAAIRADALHN